MEISGAEMIECVMDRYVYVLPNEDGSPFYIGVGKGDRMHHHVRKAKRGILETKNKTKHQYIVDCIQRGYTPEPYKIAEDLSIAHALAYEQTLIAWYGRRALGGGPLLNANAGGCGSMDPIPSVRARLSEAHKGRKQPLEVVAKRAASNRGQKRSAEICAKISELQRKAYAARPEKRKISPEHRAILLKAVSNPTPETRAKWAISRLGRVWSPQSLAKIAEKARNRSPEERARRSEGARRMWIRRKARAQIA